MTSPTMRLNVYLAHRPHYDALVEAYGEASAATHREFMADLQHVLLALRPVRVAEDREWLAGFLEEMLSADVRPQADRVARVILARLGRVSRVRL